MKQHRWSGWPGAYCLDCGMEDPLEIALADDELIFTDNGFEYKSEEAKERVRSGSFCVPKEVNTDESTTE